MDKQIPTQIATKEMIDYTKIEYSREWFMNKENQAHTVQDSLFFHQGEPYDNQIEIGDHFLLDLIPFYGNGESRSPTDVEIWEVENTKKRYYCKGRSQWFNFKMIRKITTGKQFSYPNGYWKVKHG